MKKPSLRDLEAFREVARHANFSKAADHLGVSRSALSHIIKGLEQYLGAQLLRRTTRSVSLTSAGEHLLTGISPILSNLDQLLFNAGHDQSHLFGEIRINGSEWAIGYLFEEVIPIFSEHYPNIKLDCVCDGELSDIVEEGFDVGIRLWESVPKDMVAIPLGPKIRFVAVASPKYLKQYSTPKTPSELSKHRCIRQRLPSGKRYHWEFSKNDQSVAVDVPGHISLDNNNVMVKAATLGLGIAFVPECYAIDQIKAGNLISVLNDWRPEEPGFYVYFPRYRHMSNSLRVFLDVIKEHTTN
ncbi:LysR family transcriptional regulator [Shewanella mangrovi]|uniref:LysR family transcriptional regulator n=1 Tax=Shewanella mangrovi TaxID=1515746 RepID=A0A094JB48_9GAMM|nr:LysR family transcriptional regulator [Shewanella mangrovi]KFZ36452.1 LysR family transcriptional regulator [Shewanella mangrovi]